MARGGRYPCHPLTAAGKRSGADTVVKGTKEAGGLVAHNDGLALLTRVADTNKWKDTAAALVRYKNGKQAFRTKLTGAASNDTSPVLDGQLAWNGKKYGAYFVVHGAGGFADGHYGDKLAYVGANGAKQSGGWGWGCSHNEGIALHPESTGAFTSFCFDDWRSGLFVSTGIAAPDNAPVVQREECWAGYCGGTYASRTGDLVKSSSGRYVTAFGSRGSASAKKNPADSSGRGWTVKPRWKTHQVALRFLKNRSTPQWQDPLPHQPAGRGPRQRTRGPVRQGPAAGLLGVPEERQVRGRHVHGDVHRDALPSRRLVREVPERGQDRFGPAHR